MKPGLLECSSIYFKHKQCTEKEVNIHLSNNKRNVKKLNVWFPGDRENRNGGRSSGNVLFQDQGRYCWKISRD